MTSDIPCDYGELERQLAGCGAPMGPAETHGFASGLVCGLVPEHGRLFEEEFFAEADPDDARVQACRRHAAALLSQVERQVASAQFVFRLCLPPEERALGERAAALRDWCRGFLYGIGLAGERSRGQLSHDAGEALRDLTALSALDAESAHGETDAEALAELEEFVRVAALLIREELRAEQQKR